MNENDRQQMHCSPHHVMYLVQGINTSHNNHHIHATIMVTFVLKQNYYNYLVEAKS